MAQGTEKEYLLCQSRGRTTMATFERLSTHSSDFVLEDGTAISSSATTSVVETCEDEEGNGEGDVLRQPPDALLSSSTTSGIISVWEMLQERRRKGGASDEAAQRLGMIPNNKWMALAFGQLIAFLAAGQNASSSTLTQQYYVNTQFFQLFLMYSLLSINILRRQRPVPRCESPSEDADANVDNNDDDDQYRLPFTSLRLKIPWWVYLFMSILDVVPNFMALFSLKYTSLTSTTLLGSLTAPATMLFAKILLSRRFERHHFVGVALCLLGGSITILGDVDRDLREVLDNSEQQQHNSFMGDLLAVTAALIYGFGDNVCEFFSKHIDRFEYMGMLGIFGTILTGLTFPFFEMDEVVGISKRPGPERAKIVGVMVWYVLSVLLYYLAQARFLVTSDATLLNLSLQAMDLWAILFAVVAFHNPPPVSFYVSVGLVIGGVFVYELGAPLPADYNLRCANSHDNDRAIRRRPVPQEGGEDETNVQTESRPSDVEIV